MKSVSTLFLESTTFHKTIENLYNKILLLYKQKYNWNLDYMKLEISNQPIYNNGKINPNMKSEQFGGCWTKKKTIRINPEVNSVKKYYNIKWPNDKFIIIIISHELAHEVYNNILTKKEKQEWLSQIPENFSTPYLKHAHKDKYKEELFCEYIAFQVKSLLK